MSLPAKSDTDLLFSLVSVQAGASVTSLSALAQTQRWNGSGGSSASATLTQGGGGTLDFTPTAAPSLGWSLGSSRPWGMIGVVLDRVMVDTTIGVPGGITVGQTFVDARNYTTPQSALDDVPVGGTVMFPNGDYTVQSGGIIVRKTMELRGERGTRLLTYGAAANQSVIRIEPGGQLLEGVTIRNLTLQNLEKPSSPIAGNYGLYCDVPTDHSKIGSLTLEQVTVRFMGDDGIRFTAYSTPNDSYFVSVAMRECRSLQNRGRGMFVTFANLLKIDGSYFEGNDLDGFRGENSQIEFHSTGFENNCLTSDTGRISATLNGQLLLKNCYLSLVAACHVENFTGTGHPVCKRGIVIVGGACATIMSTRIVGHGDAEEQNDDVRGIFITGGSNSAVMACSIQPNSFFNVKTAIEIAGGATLAKDCVVAPQWIEAGTGETKLPIAESDSGLVLLGNRRLGTNGLARGLFIPPHDNTPPPDPDHSGSLPVLDSSEVGYMLLDTTNKRLLLWDGGEWRRVQYV